MITLQDFLRAYPIRQGDFARICGINPTTFNRYVKCRMVMAERDLVKMQAGFDKLKADLNAVDGLTDV